MWHASEQITIAATPATVWSIVADLESHARLAGSGEVRSIRVSGPIGVGTIFEGAISVGSVGSFVSRNIIEVCDAPQRLAWVSYPPLDEGETDEHQIEVHWAFTLTPAGDGTRLEHTFEVPRPRAGGDELEQFLERTDRIATVAEGMRRTLTNVKDAAESR